MKAALHYAVLMLATLQLTAAFVEAAYSFGLLATDVPPAVGLVALAFVAPLALLAGKRWPPGIVRLTGLGVVAANVVEPILSPLPRVIVAGVGVASVMCTLPAMVARARSVGPAAGRGMALGLLAWATARALGQGIDATREGLAYDLRFLLVAAWILLEPPLDQKDEPPSDVGFGRVLALSLGATLALALPVLGLFLPDDMARWSEQAPVAMAAGAGGALAAWLALSAWRPLVLPRTALVTLGAVLSVAIALALLGQQVSFPADAGAYPLWAPARSILDAAVWPMALLSGIVAVLHGRFIDELVRLRPAPRKLAGAFAVAGLGALLIIAAQILTSIYDYAPVVGPLFRDRFWLVMAVPAAAMAACALAIRGHEEPLARRHAGVIGGLAVLLTMGTILGSMPRVVAPAEAPAHRPGELRMVSYNIQQGFDMQGEKNLAAQLEVLRAERPDVIGLQESDSVRAAGGHDDLVRYFAERLEMHAYYGPTPVVGTFGIALLSRFPIENARTVFLYSTGEQTAAIVARIQSITVTVVHLGNDGPIEQQRNLLTALAGEPSPLVVMGDFNFTRSSEQHALTTGHPTLKLVNAWTALRPAGTPRTPGGQADAIDHAFVTPDLEITGIAYRSGPASDHPALVVTFRLSRTR